MKQVLKDIQKALLSGVSFMMPIVVAGGVILAVSLLGAEQTAKGLVPANDILKFLNTLGKDDSSFLGIHCIFNGWQARLNPRIYFRLFSK